MLEGLGLETQDPPHRPTASSAISQTIGTQKRREGAIQSTTARAVGGRNRSG